MFLTILTTMNNGTEAVETDVAEWTRQVAVKSHQSL